MTTSWIAVTGGTGYIGSHVVSVLLEQGHNILIIDNLSNSSAKVIERLQELAPRSAQLSFVDLDMMNYELLLDTFQSHKISSVIHLAGLKAVGESVKEPVLYYHVNLVITLNLLRAMKECKIATLVHSSSASVYGRPKTVPIHEDCLLSAMSPYGWSKLFQEQMIRDAFEAGMLSRVCVLRYFNPVGAHPSGMIGEEPRGPPNNLMPAIVQCAAGRTQMKLRVFGDDYDTIDGTGVRDYIHIMDLARGHVLALNYLFRACKVFEAFNLGTGVGFSVLQVIKTLERVSGVKVEYSVLDRRPGDVSILLAAVDKARNVLGFECLYNLEDMCRDHWRWQQMNPNGYATR